MIKAAVFLADGFEEIEALTVVDYLRRAEVDVTTIAVPVVTMKAEKMPTGAHGIIVCSDCMLDEYLHRTQGDLPDCVFIPGGMPGAANIGAEERVLRFIVQCYTAGKIVAAICAAPAVVLAKTGILAGHKYTCYPGMEEGLCDYCGNPENMMKCMKDSMLVRNVPFVTDGRLVTGRGPGCAEQFAMELVRMLAGEKTAARIHEGSIQR
jgi:4-methyl-5(b-hydroxyethyl)-thiazole monophosphate biosynthesis